MKIPSFALTAPPVPTEQTVRDQKMPLDWIRYKNHVICTGSTKRTDSTDSWLFRKPQEELRYEGEYILNINICALLKRQMPD